MRKNWSNSTSALYIFMYTAAADTFLYESFVVLFSLHIVTGCVSVCICKTREFTIFPYFDFLFFFILFYFCSLHLSNLCQGKRDIKVIWIQNIWILFPRYSFYYQIHLQCLYIYSILYIWWNHLNNSYYFVQFPYNRKKRRKIILFSPYIYIIIIHADTAKRETQVERIRYEKKKTKYVANFAFPERLTK